jgi:hypothetical protein
MRISRNKKKVATWDRRSELLKQRAASEALRAVCPDAELVSVELEFKSQAPVSHARQVHALYPPAKAHFVYPCPYGDCDGVYDLQSVALGALDRRGKRVSGSLKCAGNRSREGAGGVPCTLEVSYSIVARYDVARPPRAQVSRSSG